MTSCRTCTHERALAVEFAAVCAALDAIVWTADRPPDVDELRDLLDRYDAARARACRAEQALDEHRRRSRQHPCVGPAATVGRVVHLA